MHATVLVRRITLGPRWGVWLRGGLLVSWPSIEWGRDSTIGEPLKLPHPFAIVVRAGTELGRGIMPHHVVTISQLRRLSRCTVRDAAPRMVIEDKVVSFPAMAVGAIRPGCGAVVGANQLLLEDLPPGASFVGAKVGKPKSPVGPF